MQSWENIAVAGYSIYVNLNGQWIGVCRPNDPAQPEVSITAPMPNFQ